MGILEKIKEIEFEVGQLSGMYGSSNNPSTAADALPFHA